MDDPIDELLYLASIRYRHVYTVTIAYEIWSNHKLGYDIVPDQHVGAIHRRIDTMKENGDMAKSNESRQHNHQIQFYRNPDDGGFRAVCTCGWLKNDKVLADLQSKAATHDLDEEGNDE